MAANPVPKNKKTSETKPASPVTPRVATDSRPEVLR